MVVQKNLRRFSRRFGRAKEGVTAIEFALVAPVFMLLVFGIIEFGMIMTMFNVMESATAASSRLGKTGYVSADSTREATILTAIKDRAGSLIKPEKLTVKSKFYKQYDQINDPEPFNDLNNNGNRDPHEPYTDINGNGQYDADMGVAGYGGPGDIVVYTISYPWPIMTPIMREIIGTGGFFTISTNAVVKNEPY